MFLLTLTFCVKKGDIIEEIGFEVDATLLDEVYHFKGLSLSFQPPKGWTDITEYVVKRVDNGFEYDKESPSPTILKVFSSEDIEAICSLIDYTSIVDQHYSDDNLNTLLEDLSVGKNVLRTGTYTYHGFIFRQLTIRDEGIVNIKLLINRNDREQYFIINYHIDNKAYQDNLKAIESSIGSIKKNK